MSQIAITNWDDAYSNGGYIENAGSFPSNWSRDAEDYRKLLISQNRFLADISYGSGDREILDIFLPAGTPKGLMVFVHGGYWQAFDKSSWSHFANGAVEQGWAVAMPSYTLCPYAKISEITKQIGAAIEIAASRIAGPVSLSGHSAGGHLVSRMMCKNSPLSNSTIHRLKSVVSISGLHDLRPLLKNSMNNILGMDMQEATAESAALLQPLENVSLTCWVGKLERPEFRRQNALLANIWTGFGISTCVVEAADKHHFNVIDDLGLPGSKLINALTIDTSS